MLAKDFKVGDTFTNSSGNICLVYKKTSSLTYVVNLVGNYYNMQHISLFQYDESTLNKVTVEEFINEYNNNPLLIEQFKWDSRKEYQWNKIVQQFQDLNMKQKNLLLLL